MPGKKINYHRNTLIVRNVSFSVANNLYIYFFFVTSRSIQLRAYQIALKKENKRERFLLGAKE